MSAQAGRTATVIGGNGFIGRALIRRLEHDGWAVRAAPRDAIWPETHSSLGHVFYCAGLTADFLRDPPATLQAHAGLLSRVLQSAQWDSLVYLSSTRLYDALPPIALAREDGALAIDPRNPRHFYDLTKLTGESLCQVMGATRARVARLSCVYADTADAQGFLPDVLRAVAGTPPGHAVAVASSPHFCRDYVHVADVVQALIDIAVRGTQPVYNVASGANLRNDTLAQWVREHAARRVVFESDRQAPPAPVVDMERFATEFGWQPAPAQQRIVPWLRGLVEMP